MVALIPLDKRGDVPILDCHADLQPRMHLHLKDRAS
jgi:hypothetical protein